MSFLRIPRKVLRRLVILQRDFLWGGTTEKIKISWVRWELICKPKEEGGLAVKNTSGLTYLFYQSGDGGF